MLKRVLVATAASLAVLPAALAADITFSNVFDIITETLGPQGFDFLTAFGVVFAALWMGITMLPMFQKEGPTKAAGILFAVMGGLGTAFYVYMKQIPFLDIVAPFSLFITFTLFALLIIKVILAAKEGELKGTALWTMIGFGALIMGIGLLVAKQGAIGGVVVVIGIIILAGSGIFWLAGKGWKNVQFGRPPGRKTQYEAMEEALKAVREIEYIRKKLRLDANLVQTAINTTTKGNVNAALAELQQTDRDERKLANLSTDIIKKLEAAGDILRKSRSPLINEVQAAIAEVRLLQQMEVTIVTSIEYIERETRRLRGRNPQYSTAIKPLVQRQLNQLLTYLQKEANVARQIDFVIRTIESKLA